MVTSYTAEKVGSDIVYSWSLSDGHVNEVRFVDYLTDYSIFSVPTGESSDLLLDSETNSYYVNALNSAFVSYVGSVWGDASLSNPIKVPFDNIDELESFLYDTPTSIATFIQAVEICS